MTLIKYLLVGILNTIVGFGLIFLLMWHGFSPEISNIIGYGVGICFSFVMNKVFTFKSKQASKKANLAEFIKFISSMLIAWGLNFITLKICLNFGVNAYISQIISGGIYTITGYLLSKIWVFKKQQYYNLSIISRTVFTIF